MAENTTSLSEQEEINDSSAKYIEMESTPSATEAVDRVLDVLPDGLSDNQSIPKQVKDAIFASALMEGKKMWEAALLVVDPNSKAALTGDRQKLNIYALRRLESMTPMIRKQMESYIVGILPKSIQTIEKLMDSKDEKVALAASKDIADRAGMKAIDRVHTLAEKVVYNVDVKDLDQNFAEFMMKRTSSAPSSQNAHQTFEVKNEETNAPNVEDDYEIMAEAEILEKK